MDSRLPMEQNTQVSRNAQEDGILIQQDPLAALESQWDRMARMIRDLREENKLLLEQVQEQGQRITHLEQEVKAQAEEMVVLSEEKRKTVLRIEGLLARFDDLET